MLAFFLSLIIKYCSLFAVPTMEQTNRPVDLSPSSMSPPSKPQDAHSPPRLGVLSRPTLKAPATSVRDAKQTIMKAVDLIEAENTELRTIHSEMVLEIQKLHDENERLRKELNEMSSEKEKANTEMEHLTMKHRKLQKDLNDRIGELERKLKVACDSEKRLKEENVRCGKDLDNLRNDIIHKEEDLKRLNKELECLHVQFDNSTKRHFHDRDIELLHEVEMLKNQKREWIYEKQEMTKMHKKLENEMKQLHDELQSKDSVALKDSHVHGVLKREFNQLLEENNHLKLKLRGIAPSIVKNEPSTARPHLETTTSIPASQDTGPMMATGRQVNSSGAPSVLSSSSSTPKPHQPSRDYPLSSRERSQMARSQTFTAPYKGPTGTGGLLRRNGSFSIKDSQAPRAGGLGARPAAASLQGRGSPHVSVQSSESLPSLAHKAGGKTK